jgi:hypothetical protein
MREEGEESFAYMTRSYLIVIKYLIKELTFVLEFVPFCFVLFD